MKSEKTRKPQIKTSTQTLYLIEICNLGPGGDGGIFIGRITTFLGRGKQLIIALSRFECARRELTDLRTFEQLKNQ